MIDAPYRKLRELSDRLVAAQRPIRVLDALQWPADAEARFLAADGREQPVVAPADYRPLRFHPKSKLLELVAIERDARHIGGPAAELLARRARGARAAVRLLALRGTSAFADASMRVYGGPTDAECRRVSDYLAALAASLPTTAERDRVPATVAAGHFAERLQRSLPVNPSPRVVLCDRIVSDAAAGHSYVKLRRGATFTTFDLDLLEVHEGWVHLGTTLNGRAQPLCTFLAQGPPSTSVSQEGLAVLCELLAGVAHAGRVRRLAQRFAAVRLAAAGADFRDVYRYFRDATGDRSASFQATVRVFRGCTPERGPFAKDFGYGLGLVRMLAAVRDRRRPFDLAAFFAGKLSLAERPLLHAAIADGSIVRPTFVPSVVRPGELAARLAGLPHEAHLEAVTL